MRCEFGKKYPEAIKRIKKCNILVVGNTGVGKTTLISALFQIDIENSVTEKISEKPYTHAAMSITAYDTPGLEKDKKQLNKVKQEVQKFIKQQNQKEPHEQIHAIWYCVNSQVTRESEIDKDWISYLAKELPVIAVITRADNSEDNWLKPYLKSDSNIQLVVSVMAKPQDNVLGLIKSNIDSLLPATEELLELIAKKAILNAVNVKANRAFGWCRDGCAKVLFAQMVPITGFPILRPVAKNFLTDWMLGDIAKEFGHEIDRTTLKQLCQVELAGLGAIAFENWIGELIDHLPSIDYSSMQTVNDVLLSIKILLENTGIAVPFKEYLVDLIQDIANNHVVSNIPIVNCLTVITTTISTGLLAFVFIEVRKIQKTAEYEGQPTLNEVQLFEEQIQLLLEFLRQFSDDYIVRNQSPAHK